MIHLVSVAKSYPRPGLPPRVVLRPETVSLPSDRRLAILGERGCGKTTVLQLLTHALAPDEGEVIGEDTLSPIINCGSLFHPQLTGLDNIRFIAQAYGFDADTLLMAVDALWGIDFPLDQPLKTQDKPKRKSFEVATIATLSYGCYLFDEVGQLDADLVDICIDAASSRHAGVIFTTSQPRYVLQYADTVALIKDETLMVFHDVREAVDVFQHDKRS